MGARVTTLRKILQKLRSVTRFAHQNGETAVASKLLELERDIERRINLSKRSD